MVRYTVNLLGPTNPQLDLAYGVNADGCAVGTLQDYQGFRRRAVRWCHAEERLPTDFDRNYLAEAINDSGHVVGWGEADSASVQPLNQAFFYDGTVRYLGATYGWEQSAAADINNAGLVALAGRGPGLSYRAYLYDSKAATAPQDLGVLPGHDISYALAVNGGGQVLGVSRKSDEGFDHPHAFVYDGGLIDLGPLGKGGWARDLNDKGQVVGKRLFARASELTAFLCETSGASPAFENLGVLDGIGMLHSEAMAINSAGDVVGYSTGKLGDDEYDRAFVRLASGPKAGQLLNLNDLIPQTSGWVLTKARDINDKGYIVGEGIYNGQRRAFLLVPESIAGRRPSVNIDPLALLLPGPIYAALTKGPPIPPEGPFDPFAGIRELVRQTPPEEREIVMARIRAVRAYADALEKEFSQP